MLFSNKCSFEKETLNRHGTIDSYHHHVLLHFVIDETLQYISSSRLLLDFPHTASHNWNAICTTDCLKHVTRLFAFNKPPTPLHFSCTHTSNLLQRIELQPTPYEQTTQVSNKTQIRSLTLRLSLLTRAWARCSIVSWCWTGTSFSSYSTSNTATCTRPFTPRRPDAVNCSCNNKQTEWDSEMHNC